MITQIVYYITDASSLRVKTATQIAGGKWRFIPTHVAR